MKMFAGRSYSTLILPVVLSMLFGGSHCTPRGSQIPPSYCSMNGFDHGNPSDTLKRDCSLTVNTNIYTPGQNLQGTNTIIIIFNLGSMLQLVPLKYAVTLLYEV